MIYMFFSVKYFLSDSHNWIGLYDSSEDLHDRFRTTLLSDHTNRGCAMSVI